MDNTQFVKDANESFARYSEESKKFALRAIWGEICLLSVYVFFVAILCSKVARMFILVCSNNKYIPLTDTYSSVAVITVFIILIVLMIHSIMKKNKLFQTHNKYEQNIHNELIRLI